MTHSAKHPGFKAVAARIGKEKGIRNPGAVLAAAARKASPAAKRANPRLNRVGGAKAKPGSGDIIRRAAAASRR